MAPRGQRDVSIGAQGLPGEMSVPERARGFVIFAHGSGSSRFSPQNAYAAERLYRQGFATLLFDLLTSVEGIDRRNVFDIPLLASRVIDAITWARAEPRVARLPIGLFGASTGAGAAIVAAAERPREVRSVVSRGGRPDMANLALPRITAPTMLIVGEEDRDVLGLNCSAQRMMRCPTKLIIVRGAGHLFEEPGTLEVAIKSTIDWFRMWLDEASHERSAVS